MYSDLLSILTMRAPPCISDENMLGRYLVSRTIEYER
jgi:hypothetical protein